MKAKGFGGQWVDIFRAGRHTDSAGNPHVLGADFLAQVVANFDETEPPPAVVGHPKLDAPAYGWACALRVEGGVLQAQFADVDAEFERLVREGKFKKRSASFYLDAGSAPAGRVPQLRHVGFLGAQPPAVKGLREIRFSDGEALTFETITFNEGDDSMLDDKEKKEIADGLWEKIKAALGVGEKTSAPQPASFSEADVKTLIASAVEGAEAKFTQELQQRDTEIAGLRGRLDTQTGSATRTEIISFCERLGRGQFLPAFRQMGVIEFMEQLAAIPDKKVGVVSFAEEGGVQVEKRVEITPLQFFQDFLTALPPFVEFGEKFGGLTVRGDGSEIVDPKEMEKLRSGMGLKKAEGGGK